MIGKRVSHRREWYELLGDGALISAGTMALAMGVVLLVTGVIIRGSVPVGIEFGSGILTLAAFAAGPLIAWSVHERKVTFAAIGGAFLGAPVTAVLFAAFVLVSTALGWVLKGLNDAAWFGPLVGLILVETAFVTLCVWLVVDAIRDRRKTPREHRRADTARPVAVAVVTVYATVVGAFALQPGAGEILEAIALMLIAAVAGGSAVGMADLVERLLAPKTPPAPGDVAQSKPATAG